MTTPCVYRLRNSEGTVLYVGSTGDPDRRLRTHSQEKPWWSEVTSIETVYFPDRAAAYAAEKTAIAAEKPVYSRDKVGPPVILDIHNQATDGVLGARIECWVVDGLSATKIAYKLHDEGIDVDPRTVQRWIRDRVGA